jgi:alkylated DNA repair dioxygenase AlkB
MTFIFKGQDLTQIAGSIVMEDSIYVPNFLDLIGFKADAKAGEAESFYAEIMKSIDFVPRESKEMLYRGHQLARDKFFLIKTQLNNKGEPKVLHKYMYPGFQYASLMHHKSIDTVPIIAQMMSAIEKDFLFNGNVIQSNALIGTQYHQVSDNIGYHADKIQDIATGSPIITISLGDLRELHLAYNGHEKETPAKILVMEPGSLFLLGPKTNSLMKHTLVKIADERVIKRTGAVKPRLSLVMRQIKTQMTRDQVQKKIKINHPVLFANVKTHVVTHQSKIPILVKSNLNKIPIKLKVLIDNSLEK